MLYPTELSMVQTTGFEPATFGVRANALPLSYIRLTPSAREASAYRLGKAALHGWTGNANR